MLRLITARRSCLAVLLIVCGTPYALADTIRITVTNNQSTGGMAITPVWFGLHDGTFDLFDPETGASSELEAIAELGKTGPLASSFMGLGPQVTLASGNSLPPFLPGDSTQYDLDVANPALTRYLSYASMLVPSNDLFFGNPNPTAFSIFDEMGKFTGPRTIQLFGRMTWDAGTEVNQISDGAAFVVGVDATLGTPENGSVRLLFSDPGAGDYLSSILGTTTPGGQISSIFGADDLIATLSISSVPEPSSIVLAAMGVGGLTIVARRKRGSRHQTTG